MQPVKIIIADDHKAFRTGLRYMLETYPEIEIAGLAKDGAEALQLIEHYKPQVILLDLQMPVLDGYEVLEILKKKHKPVKALVISTFVEEWHVRKAFDAGAVGIVSKDAGEEEIITAITSIMQNNFYLSEKLHLKTIKDLLNEGKLNPVFNKTSAIFDERELLILEMICREYTSADIAEKLFIGQKAIEKIRGQMLDKTNAKTSIGLVVYALQNNLISMEQLKRSSEYA